MQAWADEGGMYIYPSGALGRRPYGRASRPSEQIIENLSETIIHILWHLPRSHSRATGSGACRASGCFPPIVPHPPTRASTGSVACPKTTAFFAVVVRAFARVR